MAVTTPSASPPSAVGDTLALVSTSIPTPASAVARPARNRPRGRCFHSSHAASVTKIEARFASRVEFATEVSLIEVCQTARSPANAIPAASSSFQCAAAGSGAARVRTQQPQRRRRERDAPECGGGGPGLGHAHPDGGKRDAGRSGEQCGQRNARFGGGEAAGAVVSGRHRPAMLTVAARHCGVRIFPIHGRAALRPSPLAQRVLGDGRNRPHRRRGRARRIGRDACAGDHGRGKRVRHGQVLQGRACGGRQADHRRGLLDPERRRPRQAAPGRHAVRLPCGLSATVGAALPGVARQPAPRARRDCPRLARGAQHGRPDRALGGRRRRRRPGAGGGNFEAAQRLARGWQALFPGRYYVELQRAGLPHGETLFARSVELASQLGLPVVATHPVQFLDPGDFKAHEARVCIAAGLRAGRSAAAPPVHAGAALQDPGGDGAAVRRHPAGARELGRNRAALQPYDRARQEPAAGFSDARRE